MVEQNRDAQMRIPADQRMALDPARLVPVLHYDGTPITARFIAARSPDANCAADQAAPQGGHAMTYIAKPRLHHPTLPPEQARLHAARLRRRGLDAVRRLRARLDFRRDHPGLLRTRHRAAPRGQAVGHRLLLQDADLLPGRLARLQHACTAACRRC